MSEPKKEKKEKLADRIRREIFLTFIPENVGKEMTVDEMFRLRNVIPNRIERELHGFEAERMASGRYLLRHEKGEFVLSRSKERKYFLKPARTADKLMGYLSEFIDYVLG